MKHGIIHHSGARKILPKILFVPLFCVLLLMTGNAYCQITSSDIIGRLYYTAKVWGYLKYFHPAVNGCNKNLDSILIAIIPEVESDTTDSAFNRSLLKLFAYAGPMPAATTPDPSLTADQRINLDLAWQRDATLSPEIQALLDSIRANFRPVQSCYYQFNPNYVPPYSINENSYSTSIAITEPYRLLTLFRVWNLYNYFYPYKTLLDSSWDSTLMEMIPLARGAETTTAFHLALMEIQAKLQDAHAVAYSDTLSSHFGYHYFPMIFSYIDSQTVITKVFNGVTGVRPGDVVVSINGVPTQRIRDSLIKYTPGGNAAVINRNISLSLLQGQSSLAQTVVVNDGSGPRTVAVKRTSYQGEVGDSMNYWQGDGSHWKILPGNIGFVNMGLLDSSDVEQIFPALKDAPAIIFDMRNYPQNFLIYQLCDSLMPNSVPFARWFIPDPYYPGTGQITVTNCGPSSENPNCYKGRVILLVDEVTQSRAEFFAMAFSHAPRALIIGSQTAGTDGNIDYTSYPTNISMYYTSYGVSFSDGRQTQRIGIIPNVIVHPTLAGIRSGTDEVLDTAIVLAGGFLAVYVPQPISSEIQAYPNPLTSTTTITLSSPAAGFAEITVVNLLGIEVARVFAGAVDAGERSFVWQKPSGLPAGMYECIVRMNGHAERVGMIVE